jgi:hypothetical protein
MWRVTRLLLTVVLLALLSAMPMGTASAAFCYAEHEQSLGTRSAPAHSQREPSDQGHHNHMNGDCFCPCCASAGSAALAVPVELIPLARTLVVSLTPQPSRLLTGITIRPLTGPPKLSV